MSEAMVSALIRFRGLKCGWLVQLTGGGYEASCRRDLTGDEA